MGKCRSANIQLEPIRQCFPDCNIILKERYVTDSSEIRRFGGKRANRSRGPTRVREKAMRRFKSAGHAQRFLSAFGLISSHFRVGRHLYSANGDRIVMKIRFAVWNDVIGIPLAVRRQPSSIDKLSPSQSVVRTWALI